ncbi:MAG: gluconate:H+ symporter [Balneolaceae bacterium]
MTLIAAVLAGICLLLILILYFRIQAFIALLTASIAVGLLAGLNPDEINHTILEGMGSTLGFVATVIGLGVIFGSILEHSGGASVIAQKMLAKFGAEKAPLAMVTSGFIIAIPVFFEVAFIILAPIIFVLQKQTGKSLLLYAIPLLAGLAVTHAFIPPTPGPIAVASIIDADLGMVILLGMIVGLPTAIVSGLMFGKFIAGKIHIEAPEEFLKDLDVEHESLPGVGSVLTLIGIPIFLILLNTTLSSSIFLSENLPYFIISTIELIGHPIPALIIANLLAWYYLGIKRNYSKEELSDITTKSMMPAGAVILLTGAGGVFKQVLVDTGAGEMLAETMTEYGIPILLLAYLAAVAIRVLQGSATVAMITAAGLVSPLIAGIAMTEIELAALVIAIAAGASILSHVNDSGFWLVSQYLGMTEEETFKSWTMMTTILSLTGFLCISVIYMLYKSFV